MASRRSAVCLAAAVATVAPVSCHVAAGVCLDLLRAFFWGCNVEIINYLENSKLATALITLLSFPSQPAAPASVPAPAPAPCPLLPTSGYELHKCACKGICYDF